MPRSKIGGAIGSSKEVQARDCSIEGDPSFPEGLGVTHQKTAFPETGEGNRKRLQNRSPVSAVSNRSSTGGRRSIPGGTVRRQ